jgi:hypothetical protein
MPSTIPLYSLPSLNSQNARNGEVLIDQPAIGRRTLSDDEVDEDEEGEGGEAEADAEADGDRGLRVDLGGVSTRTRGTRGALARARARGAAVAHRRP